MTESLVLITEDPTTLNISDASQVGVRRRSKKPKYLYPDTLDHVAEEGDARLLARIQRSQADKE